jgi:type IV secretory pathway TraG/TraD family ATPase VirD4
MLLGNVSRTTHEVQRPLLTPDECMRMQGPIKDDHGMIEKPGDMLVFMAGYPAIYGVQPLYFKDPALMARSRIPPPAKSDTLISQFKYRPSSRFGVNPSSKQVDGVSGRIDTEHDHSIHRGVTSHVRSSNR